MMIFREKYWEGTVREKNKDPVGNSQRDQLTGKPCAHAQGFPNYTKIKYKAKGDARSAERFSDE